MDKISKAKSEFRLRQWTQIIHTCQESGMTAKAWCGKNNVNSKTYYYWLRKIRSLACETNNLLPTPNNQQIVPMTLKQTKQSAAVTINLHSMSVEIHDGAAKETIETVISALKSIC